MNVKNLTEMQRQVLSGVKFLTRHKYLYGQRSHRTNIKKLGGVNGIQTNIFDERIFLTS